MNLWCPVAATACLAKNFSQMFNVQRIAVMFQADIDL